MVDLILIFVIAAILGSVIGFIWKSKKAGHKCIGCPDSKTCSGHCSGCGGSCGCH